MSVYVDDARNRYGYLVMSHMIADSWQELDDMAQKLGLRRKWVQHAGTKREHYDISQSKRALAVKAGAIEITSRELVRRLK